MTYVCLCVYDLRAHHDQSNMFVSISQRQSMTSLVYLSIFTQGFYMTSAMTLWIHSKTLMTSLVQLHSPKSTHDLSGMTACIHIRVLYDLCGIFVHIHQGVLHDSGMTLCIHSRAPNDISFVQLYSAKSTHDLSGMTACIHIRVLHDLCGIFVHIHPSAPHDLSGMTICIHPRASHDISCITILYSLKRTMWSVWYDSVLTQEYPRIYLVWLNVFTPNTSMTYLV